MKKSFLILRAVQLAIFKMSQLSRLSPFLGHLFNQLSILEENQVKQELQQIFHQNTIKCIRTSNSWTIGHLSLMSSYAPAGPYYRGRLLVCLFGRLVDFKSESFGETKTAGEACGSLVWLMLWWEDFFSCCWEIVLAAGRCCF